MSEQSQPLILVVDDYQDAREMYAEYLQFSGFRVAEARNGNEAVEQAFALKPDLILMESGTLNDQQTEDVGLALMKLEETVRDIAAKFGIPPEDLNLDLGPIGKLM